MVSIMPGMDSRAPERTETRRGFFLSPNFLPKVLSSLTTAASIWGFTSEGNFFPCL